jgi:hypothetical protein
MAAVTGTSCTRISCNVIARLAHDHVFVGWDQGPRALALLGAL